jgi:hypothetical protein
MKRITRKRRLTKAEAAAAQDVRAKIEKEWPPVKTRLKYVALAFNAWDSIHAVTPLILSVAPLGKSSGFMLVYDSLATLRKDYPESEYLIVAPATDTKPLPKSRRRKP